MMIEFGDHSEEERRLLLRYLDGLKEQHNAGAPPPPPKPNWYWRLIGRIWLAYVRWRYGHRM